MAVGSLSGVSIVPTVEKKSWNRSVGRGPLSSCPILAYSRSELVGGVVNVRARSPSRKAFHHGLRGVMYCTVDRSNDSSEEPHTHLTEPLDTCNPDPPSQRPPHPHLSLYECYRFTA